MAGFSFFRLKALSLHGGGRNKSAIMLGFYHDEVAPLPLARK